jgi:predicted RNA-binding Zn ribbon-like protein
MTFTMKIIDSVGDLALVQGLSQADAEALLTIARGMRAKFRAVTCECGTVFFETSRSNRTDCTPQCGTNRRVKAHRERKAGSPDGGE